MAEEGPQDWIELFLDATEGIPSPEIFRLWSGISAVAGAVERRVWLESAQGKLYPNLYVMLVSNPGVGKTQAIGRVDSLWRLTRELKVAPHDVTKAAFIDALKNAGRRIIKSESTIIEYHTLLVAADELGVFIPAYDLDFLSSLNRIYDNPDVHQQNRRGFGDEQIDIINPQLTILGGVQPAYLAQLLPEAAWGQGFMSRMIMVYSALPIKTKLFAVKAYEKYDRLMLTLLPRMKQMLKLYGAMPVASDAEEAIENWYAGGMEPVPQHSRLEHYISRRVIHVLKLSMISAVSRQNSLITLDDFNRARGWLVHAEGIMPDIFREMVQRSDSQVIQELHFFAWQLWIRDKKPIHATRLLHFLQNRVPSEKVHRVLDIAEKAGFFEKIAGADAYRPRPKHEHGME